MLPKRYVPPPLASLADPSAGWCRTGATNTTAISMRKKILICFYLLRVSLLDAQRATFHGPLVQATYFVTWKTVRFRFTPGRGGFAFQYVTKAFVAITPSTIPSGAPGPWQPTPKMPSF